MVIIIVFSFFISNLDSGIYMVKLVDDNGCSDIGEVILDNDGFLVDFVFIFVYNDCELCDIIKVVVVGGEGFYIVGWDGFEFGERIFDGISFEFIDLLFGVYDFKIEDENGCGDEDDIVVFDDILNLFELVVLDGDCEDDGVIKVDM